jgi:hypothetical protein
MIKRLNAIWRKLRRKPLRYIISIKKWGFKNEK